MKTALRWIGYTLGLLIVIAILVSVSDLVRGFLLLSALVVYCWHALDQKITQRMDGISRALEAIHEQRRTHS